LRAPTTLDELRSHNAEGYPNPVFLPSAPSHPAKKRFGPPAMPSEGGSLRQRRRARIAIPRPSCAGFRQFRSWSQRFFIGRALRAFPVEPGLVTTAAGGVCTTGAGTGCAEAAGAGGTAAGEGVESPAAGAAVAGVRFVVSMGSILFECSIRRRRDDPGSESALHRLCRNPCRWPNSLPPNSLCRRAPPHHSRRPALVSPIWANHAPVGARTCKPRNRGAVNPESRCPRRGGAMNLPQRSVAK
jgi:hypothetical protein